MDFLLSLIHTKKWYSAADRTYRIKSMRLPAYDLQESKSSRSLGLVFQKELTDITNYSDRYCTVRILGEDYAPILT